jgi:tripartite-type tricarboxylate transporter receptor subunit TctC
MQSYKSVTWFAAALLAFGASIGAGHAQNYPTKPVRLIAPFAPGGGTDIMARILAQKLTEMWGQQTIVDNRSGAGTIIGTELTVRAQPDGYTMMLANIALALNPGLRSKLPYDTLKDLTPVSLLASQPNALVVHPGFSAKSVQELVTLVKGGAKLNYGSSGTGGVGHITGEMLRLALGGDLGHVPYKGGAPAAVDVMSGQIPLAIISLPTVMPHVKAGKLRILAVSDSKRSSSAPDVPTLSETVPGFEVNNWVGVLGPAGMRPALVRRLNADIAQALKAQDVRERLFAAGFEVQSSTPEQFASMIRADIEKYAKVIREAGIQAH